MNENLRKKLITEINNADQKLLIHINRAIINFAHSESIKKPIFSKNKVKNIINNYESTIKNKPKTLIICHGHSHSPSFKNSLLLNRSDIVKPDIVSS